MRKSNSFDTCMLEDFRTPSFSIEYRTRKRTSTVSIMMLLLVSMPRMALQMAWAAQWAALGPYLGTMLPRYAVQLTQLIGPLTGITTAPIVGVLSDRTTSRWGRRRPFLLFGAISSCVCWILMGYTRQVGELLGDYGTGEDGTQSRRTWTGVLTIFFYTWMDITVNIVQTPALLLIADCAGDRQTTGAALGQSWSTIGSLVVSAYIEVFGAAHLTLRYFLGMLAGFMFVTIALVCMFVHEEPISRLEVSDETAWQRIRLAFMSIWQGLSTLPRVLVYYAIIFFCVMFGYTAYNGNKGQFFGVEVYHGNPDDADRCGTQCTTEQQAYNRGVQTAGGSTDMMFNALGYVYLWVLPFLVAKIGAKWLLTLSLVPQTLLMLMAFSKSITLNVAIVVVITFTQGTVFALVVPIIVHVFGPKAEIGMYVGALNSANCFGQLLNFIIGAAIVDTSMGYKLPVFLGGAMSLLGILVSLFIFHIRLHSL